MADVYTRVQVLNSREREQELGETTGDLRKLQHKAAQERVVDVADEERAGSDRRHEQGAAGWVELGRDRRRQHCGLCIVHAANIDYQKFMAPVTSNRRTARTTGCSV